MEDNKLAPEQGNLNFTTVDKTAIFKMKDAMLGKDGQPGIEAQLRALDQSQMKPWDKDARTEILSAMGTVDTFRESKLGNPAYVETLKADIALLNPEASTRPGKFREEYNKIATQDDTISRGLKELSALIELTEQKKAATTTR